MEKGALFFYCCFLLNTKSGRHCGWPYIMVTTRKLVQSHKSPFSDQHKPFTLINVLARTKKNCFWVVLVFEATDNSYETLLSMEINILSGDDIFIFIYYIITVHTNHSMVPSAQCSMHSLQSKCDFRSSYSIEPMTVMQWAGHPLCRWFVIQSSLKVGRNFRNLPSRPNQAEQLHT